VITVILVVVFCLLSGNEGIICGVLPACNVSQVQMFLSAYGWLCKALFIIIIFLLFCDFSALASD